MTANVNELFERLKKESEEATEFPSDGSFKRPVLTQYPATLQIADTSPLEHASDLAPGVYRKKP